MKIKTTADLIAAVAPLVAEHDAANFGSGERAFAYRAIRNRFENIDLARSLLAAKEEIDRLRAAVREALTTPGMIKGRDQLRAALEGKPL